MTATRFVLLAATLACVTALPAAARATILDDFNASTIITDFTFDDPQGTMIPGAANSGTLGGSFDTDPDSDDVVTDGGGLLDASAKANTDFGAHYVDLPTISTGRVIGLLDVSWEFDESIYDDAQEEEFRLTLISNDPRGTFTTAEINFERTSATEVTLFGNTSGNGGEDTPDTVFGSSGSLLTLIDLDVESRVFELFYSSDDGATFTSGGTGLTGDFVNNTPEFDLRPVSSVRLVINEDFSDDSLTIDRFAVAVPEPASLVLAAMGVAAAAKSRRA